MLHGVEAGNERDVTVYVPGTLFWISCSDLLPSFTTSLDFSMSDGLDSSTVYTRQNSARLSFIDVRDGCCLL